MLTIKNIFFFGYIKLNKYINIANKFTEIKKPVPDKIYIFLFKIKPAVRMLANEFQPLLITADRDGKHLDVLYLTDLLTGTQIKGGELYPLSALTDLNRVAP